MNGFKLQDLQTGDIIVNRDGEAGFVFTEKSVIIYQNSGMDFLNFFSEDLLWDEDDNRGLDIMAVYRDCFGSPVSFIDYEDCDTVFEREDDAVWDKENYIKEQKKAREDSAARDELKPGEKVYSCIIQAFYGNRVATQFTEDSVDALIHGCTCSGMFDSSRADRTAIAVPGEEGMFILYDKNKEQQCLRQNKEAKLDGKRGFTPLAIIPELGITLYSRCIACRMDKDGKFEDLRDGDCEIIFKYFAD